MKLSYAWLKEWVDVPWNPQELGTRLTMAGFELEGIEPAGHDSILALNVTPNRGDVLSVLGIAREVAALSGNALKEPLVAVVATTSTDTLPMDVDVPQACPVLVGRLLLDLDNRRPTPSWMQERLRGAEIRSVSPVVDVTNYVLLELGQPMHAYDAAELKGEVRVRAAHAAERLLLLDERLVELDSDMLVIADRAGAVGLAGIMGGARTAVAPHTRRIFLEVAYFAPSAMRGRARRLGLHTDASQHFERGVDPTLQKRAIERATALLLEIAGGKAGPVVALESSENQPARPEVLMRSAQLARLLGTTVAPKKVVDALGALQMTVRDVSGGWQVSPRRIASTLQSRRT